MSVELTHIEEFALITLNRPEALNALSFKIVKDIGKAIDEVAEGRARALMITGAGDKSFCAGADIKEFMGRNIVEEFKTTQNGQHIMSKLDHLHIPSVAVINGYALGGGLELATACTFRIALQHAQMGLPEIKLGLIPGYGGTQRLPRLIGEARALDMIMTGRMVNAKEALQIGLINRIIEGNAIESGISFCREFSGYSLPVLRYARDAVTRAGSVGLTEGLAIERDLNTLAFEGEDSTEGAEAFINKRQPAFKDR